MERFEECIPKESEKRFFNKKIGQIGLREECLFLKLWVGYLQQLQTKILTCFMNIQWGLVSNLITRSTDL